MGIGLFGSSKQTSKVTPWIPNSQQFGDLLRNAGQSIAPGFTSATAAGRGILDQLSATPGVAPGVMGTAGNLMRQTQQNYAPQPAGTSGLLAAAAGNAATSAPPQSLVDAVTRATSGGYAPGFQETMASAMDPAARSAAWGQVRDNTIAGIMPAINATFSGAGMTGSTGHEQNLAKGLAAGLADVENSAYQTGMDRAVGAATTSQQALMDQLGLGVSAGSALGDAQRASAALGLAGGQAMQDRYDTQFNQGLAGAAFNQGALTDTLNANLAGANLGQGATDANFANLGGLAGLYQSSGNAQQDAFMGALQSWLASAGNLGKQTVKGSSNPGVLGTIGAGLQIASMFGGGGAAAK